MLRILATFSSRFLHRTTLRLICRFPNVRLHVCIMYKRIILFRLGAFLRSFPNTKPAIVRPRTHLLNFSFASTVFLLLPFSFFFSASMDDSLVCKRYLREWLYLIAQALDEFHPILFWPRTLHISGTHYTYAFGLLLLAILLLELHAHNACSVTAPTINMWSWIVNPFSEYTLTKISLPYWKALTAYHG